MTIYYHGSGSFIETTPQTPFFLYEKENVAQFFATGYTTGEQHYLYEVEVNSNIKSLDLDTEEGQLVIDELMKKHQLKFEDDEYLLVIDSYEKAGREVYGYDVDLVLLPELKESLSQLGYQMILSSSAFENFSVMGYALLDTSVMKINKVSEIVRKNDDEYELVEITNSTNKKSLKP